MEATATNADYTEALDPRIRRTRELLQQALAKLLDSREFEKISVQDITDGATVNRATFYAHYPDKFALLECLVAGQFNTLLSERGVVFDGTCTSALSGIVLGLCDFLALRTSADCERQRQLEPHMESAVVAVIRKMLLSGLQQHPTGNGISPELQAATVSGAIYGAAKEWVLTPHRVPSEQIAATVLQLVTPILHPADAPNALLSGPALA
jgi:AcrR family transcriptional regulator